MANFKTIPKLSIIVPTLNEANNLPLLLADLSLLDEKFELIISDAGSEDMTRTIGELAGAKILHSKEANRGLQMKAGAKKAIGEWLLFIHADCRLNKSWVKKFKQHITKKCCKNYAWFFNFKVNKKGLIFRILEIFVSIRSNLLKRPYGDQGLLITKELYELIGGYKDLKIMEDLEIILRLSKAKKIRSISIDLISDGRKWNKRNVIHNGIKNAILRYRWRRGEDTNILANDYYLKNEKI